MITLNTEKGLIKVESWQEVHERPGFVETLDPSEHKLKEIIGNYDFIEKVRCGLSICHTPHFKGYIVTTENGHETNIGWNCGAKYFGVEFETQSRRFDRLVTESENRTILREFNIDNLQEQIVVLRTQEKGADWVNSNLTPFKQNKFPSIAKELFKMLKTRSNQLIITEQATEQEIEAIEVAENVTLRRPHYIERSIADISGLEALHDENDIRELVVLQLEKKLIQFRNVDINQLSYRDLEEWVKWIGSVDSILNKVSEVIRNARLFLTRDNLKPLQRFCGGYDESTRFSSFLSRLK